MKEDEGGLPPSDLQPNLSHIVFFGTNAFYLGDEVLERLLLLLDELEPVERHRILSPWLYKAWGVRRPKGVGEEALITAQLEEFEGRCWALLSVGFQDYFIVYSVVTFLLTTLYESATGIRDDYEVNAETPVNLLVERQLARNRYRLFCERILEPLLIPPDLRNNEDAET